MPVTPTTARLRHVAEHAGVSEATVSRVVNHRPGVSDDTRRRVLDALERFGYESSPRLRQNRAGLVGLLIPELSNPIFPAMAQVLLGLLNHRRFATVMCTATEDGVSEEEHIEMLLDRGLSGLVVVSGRNADSNADHSMYRRLDEYGMPMVFLNGGVTDVVAPVVSCDDGHAAEIAVRHLAELGHRDIGCIVGQRRYVNVQRRVAGFEAVVAELGVRGMIVDGGFTVEGGAAAAGMILDDGATAIVSASDLMALGAIRAARVRGLRVPEDVSVIGYDDSPLLVFCDPPLTTVRQPIGPMADAAVGALVDRINGVDRDVYALDFQADLVLRQSTAAAPTLH